MFGFRNKKNKKAEVEFMPHDSGNASNLKAERADENAASENALVTEDIKISYPVTPPADGVDLDAMSVIDAFLSSNDAQAVPAPADVGVSTGEGEPLDMELTEEDLRIRSLASVMLHYYLSCHRSWLEAIFTALDEVPAMCLSVPGSPIEYLDDIALADEMAEELGYRDWGALSQKMAEKMAAHPFLEKFAVYTLDFSKVWFVDITAVSPEQYASAIISELRGNMPGIKGMGADYVNRIFTDIPDGRVEVEGLGEGVIIGVETVNDEWMPAGMSVVGADSYEESKKHFEEVQKQKRNSIGNDGIDVEAAFDEGILSVTYLQNYIWSNRSWNRAEELAEDFLNSCFTFSMACISPDYSTIDVEAAEVRAERLDELAKELMNDNGEIELQQVRPGNPNDPSTLDDTSREFVELNEEQSKVQFVADVNQVIGNLMPAIAGPYQTVADMVIDEILACVWAASDLSDSRNQLACMQSLHDEVVKMMKSKSKQFKSQWKKEISSDEALAQRVKDGKPISDWDGEELLFVEDVFNAPAVTETGQDIEEQRTHS